MWRGGAGEGAHAADAELAKELAALPGKLLRRRGAITAWLHASHKPWCINSCGRCHECERSHGRALRVTSGTTVDQELLTQIHLIDWSSNHGCVTAAAAPRGPSRACVCRGRPSGRAREAAAEASQHHNISCDCRTMRGAEREARLTRSSTSSVAPAAASGLAMTSVSPEGTSLTTPLFHMSAGK